MKTTIQKTVHTAVTLPNGNIQTKSYCVRTDGTIVAVNITEYFPSDWKMIFVHPRHHAKVEVVVTLDGKPV